MVEENSKYRILVVDDEDQIRGAIYEALAEHGYSVAAVASGLDAMLKLAHEDFDIMLLDVRMPVMDGMEVLRRAKAEFPGLIVIMLTGMATEKLVKEAAEQGVYGYLVKPVSIDRLIETIEEALSTRYPDVPRSKKREAEGSTRYIKVDVHSESVKRILVVDDEEAVMKAVCQVLSEEGFEVVGVTSGKEGLQMAARDKFQMVILDLMMPEMDGMEFLRRIKVDYSGIIAIVLTGVLDRFREIEEEAIAQGGYAFLKKPVSISNLVKTVKSGFVEESGYWNRL